MTKSACGNAKEFVSYFGYDYGEALENGAVSVSVATPIHLMTNDLPHVHRITAEDGSIYDVYAKTTHADVLEGIRNSATAMGFECEVGRTSQARCTSTTECVIKKSVSV